MITTAWRIGTRHAIAIRAQRPTIFGPATGRAARTWQSLEQAAADGEGRLCKWAHMLGYGGHFLTKSRRYSTTFGQPCAAPDRAPPPATAPRWRTRPLGAPPRRARSPGPAHLGLQRHRLRGHPRR